MKAKRLAAFAAGVIALGYLGLAGLCWIGAGALVKPRTVAVLLPAAYRGESLALQAADGIRLAATFLEGDGRKACVLVLHGNGTNRAGMTHIFRLLHDNGYGVFAIDFRGHGASDAVQTTAGYDERLDANVAFDTMRKKCPARKTAIYGFSLGGAAALLGTAAQRTDALILDAVYPDIESAVDVRVARALGPPGRWIVTPVLMKMLEWRTGIDRSRMRPVDAAAKITAPTLFLAGGADDRAPESGMRAMQSHMRGASAFIVVPGADHGANAATLGPEFNRRILGFLAQNLKNE